MLLVFLVATALLDASCGDNVLEQERAIREDYSAEDRVVSCVTRLLKWHYAVNQLTFVEIGYSDEHLLRAVHSQTLLGIIYRKVTVHYHLHNQGYLLTTSNASDFAQNFPLLAREATWNAHVKTIILVKRVEEGELREIFDVLMRYHVVDVVVVNWLDLCLYTYNPYENYGCGKYYNRIIKFGSCHTVSVSVDIFPDKLINRLRGCTITVLVSHVPPYAINPSKIKQGIVTKGVEQYALEIAAEKEQFNITYIYNYSEDYSTFTNNTTIIGPMSMIQNGNTDMMIGAVVLSQKRAAVFDYISSHLNLDEEIRCLVKKASPQPVWKYFYIEFEYSVWLLLLVSFVVVAVFIILVLKIRDRCYVFIMLLNTLVIQTVYKINYSGWAIKCIIIFWLWFVYLVNCFYQSNLYSLITKPGYEPQISNVYDLRINNMKSCVSTMVSTLLLIETKVVLNNSDPNCKLFFDSIRTVSMSDDKFTFVLYSLYSHQKYDFYDEYGNDLLYVFDHVFFKLSYAMFMYKGFPLRHSLYKIMIRLRENGLIEKHGLKQKGFMKITKKYHYKYKAFEGTVIIPWYLFSFGLIVSFIALVAEVTSSLISTRN